MPWKECHVVDERLRFVARLLEGEKMAPRISAFSSQLSVQLGGRSMLLQGAAKRRKLPRDAMASLGEHQPLGLCGCVERSPRV